MSFDAGNRSMDGEYNDHDNDSDNDSDHDSDHDHDHKWNIRSKVAISNSTPHAAAGGQRPPFGLTVVEENGTAGEKDITELHSKWNPETINILVPSRKRSAVQWQAAHTYFTFEGHEMFICNICGRDLKLSGSVSAVTAHLTHRHPGIKERLEMMEQQKLINPNSNKKKRGLLPLAKLQETKLSAPPPPPTQKNPGRVVAGGPKQEDHKPAKKTRRPKTDPAQVLSNVLEAVRKAEVSQIVAFGFPYAHCKSGWHQRLLETTTAAVQAGVTVEELELTQKDIKETVFSATKKLREHLKEHIKGRTLCCVTEHHLLQVSPDVQIVYSTFRVQWVQDFCLRSGVLAVHVTKQAQSMDIAVADTKHGHAHHYTSLDAKLQEWDLPSKDLRFVVTDIPSSLENKSFGFDIQDKAGKMEQIYCLDYLLNLVATKAFEGFLGKHFVMVTIDKHDHQDKEDLSFSSTLELLPKTAKLVAYFQNSIEANDELMKVAQQLNISNLKQIEFLSLDETSKAWWSWQIMLERLLKLREAVTTYVSRQWSRSNNNKPMNRLRPPRITEQEWEVLDELCVVLRPLRFAHQMLSGYQLPSAPLVPLVAHLIYQDLEKIGMDKDSFGKKLAEIAGNMLNIMTQQFGNFSSQSFHKEGANDNDAQVHIPNAFLYAHALDPRFKLLSVFPPLLKERIWDGLLEEMCGVSPDSVPSPSSRKRDNSGVEGTVRQSQESTELDVLFKMYSYSYSHSHSNIEKDEPEEEPDAQSSWRRRCQSELMHYRESDTGMEPNLDTDVLRDWWILKSTQYPILWRLAQRYFSVSATCAPPARAFSLTNNKVILRGYHSGSDEMIRFLQENATLLSKGDFFLP